MQRLLRGLLLLALPALAACARDGDALQQGAQAENPAAQQTDGQPAGQAALLSALAGTQWQLAGGLPGHDPARVDVSLAFDGQGRIGGTGGCNSYGAALSASDGELRVGPVVSTKRACPGARSEVETAWFAALDRVRRLERAHGALLLHGEGLQLRMVPVLPDG